MKRVISVVAMIVVICGVSSLGILNAQSFRHNFPRPRPDTPPMVETASSVAARSGVIDDGYTWFEAVSTEELGPNQSPVSTGWVLKSYVRIFGEYPNRSAIKLVVSKGGKPVATTRCEIDSYRKGPTDVDESYMWTNECWRKDTATKEIGNFDVNVFTVNGDTDEEKLVRTYKIDVRTVNRVNSGQQPGNGPPHYYIQRHAEAPVSFIFLRPRGYTSYADWSSRPERSGANQVELYFSLSPSSIGMNLPHGYMRCSVDGKRLSMPGPMPYADQALSHVVHSFQVIYTDRLAPQYKRGTEYRDDIGFRMVRLKAPLTWGDVRETNRLALEDYPGNWECSLMNNGEVWRTWKWRIGSDGRPEVHPEQKGNVNLYFNSYLVDMVVPPGGSPLDKRLVPEATSTGLFYGQPWRSAEGKAMVARLPKKGTAVPLPSTSQQPMN